jgi:hypothetical protein
MIHLFFLPILLPVILVLVVVRILTAPFRYGRWHRRYYGYGRGWRGDGYWNPYRGGVLTVLAIVALERLFGRRY